MLLQPSILRLAATVGIAVATQALAAQNPPSSPLNPSLARMSARMDLASKARPFDFSAYQALGDSVRSVVFRLIELDSLPSAADFLTASLLVFDPTGFFDNRRVEHEMALTALVLGAPNAMRRLAFTWDGLNLSMGLGQRIGSYTNRGVANNMDPVPAPPFVQAIFKDLDAARRRASGATNNAELQRMRDADQADREDPIDEAKMKRMDINDPKRLARVMELVAANAPLTGRDMQNAATVLQHGGRPNDYRLAHELSVAAYALGDTTSLWLISRSYDRMLLHFGHRQRLATQFTGIKLSPIDTVATNDRERELLGGRKLSDVRAGAHP